MKNETYRACLDTAIGFKEKYGITVTAGVFKEVLIYTLHKMARIRKQLEDYVDTNEYLILLFEDCLREYYMFTDPKTMRQRTGA